MFHNAFKFIMFHCHSEKEIGNHSQYNLFMHYQSDCIKIPKTRNNSHFACLANMVCVSVMSIIDTLGGARQIQKIFCSDERLLEIH